MSPLGYRRHRRPQHLQLSTPPHLSIHPSDLPSRSHCRVAHCSRSVMTHGQTWLSMCAPQSCRDKAVKAVALAHLGHLDAARAELNRMLAIDPKLTIAGYRAYAHFAAPEFLELFVSGLRLAGLPEE